MIVDLEGRTALVTGSGSGIGRATAAGLLAAGATVIINDLDDARVAKAIEWIGTDRRLSGVAADLGTAEGCQAVFDVVPDVDVLVNNIGVATPIAVFDIPDSEWERLFTVNVMSGIRMTRRYLPAMIERGWGRAIFIASECGLHIPHEMVHYGVSKAAVLASARGFAESVAGTEVTVNSVVPGPTRTDGSERFMRSRMGEEEVPIEDLEGEYIDTDRPSSLLRRFTLPEEVSNMVIYLASELSSATTGAALRADGGVVRSIG